MVGDESIRQSRQSESSSPDGVIHGRTVNEPLGHPRTRGDSHSRYRSDLNTPDLVEGIFNPQGSQSQQRAIAGIADIRPGRARLEGLESGRQTGGVDWLPFFYGLFWRHLGRRSGERPFSHLICWLGAASLPRCL
jgi:hypothetical protein